ncbi:MAG: tetratricopeptide repeat protein [Flavobacteriaceae bacterium]
MKQLFTLLLGLALTFGLAQKKELKQAQKLFKGAKIAEAKTLLSNNEGLFSTTADKKIKTQYHFLKAKIARSESDFAVAYENYQLAEGNSSIKTALADEISELTVDVVKAAIDQSDKGDYLISAKNLYLAYQINPESNITYLYFAATNAVNAADYELALKYYIKLRELNYTGVETKYYATLVATGDEAEISSSEYTLYAKSKDYTNLREEQTPSRYPEIVKNIALLYNQLGQKDQAIKAVKDAREANPGDIGLILTEANIYIELDEKERYQELVIEALAQDPTNAVLYFNLGVVNSDLGDKAKSREFYEKAIEYDSSMTNAYLNLVALILEDEANIVDQMNSLGNSRADNLKYDKLKAKRENVYLECVPILKKLIDLDDSNIEAIRTLKNIYGTIGDNAGFMEMKALEQKAEQ